MTTEAVKAFAGLEIKDVEKGEVEAIIATLEVVDRDGDIIRKGAIPDGATVAMSGYGHDAVFGSRPVGKGVIRIEGNKALFKGRVFLNTSEGRDTFEVLKEMGKDQEWSWGFRVIGSEVPDEKEKKQGAWRILTKTQPFEVSPVIMGAGIGTRTVGVKGTSAQADGGGEEIDTKLIEIATAALKAHRAAEAAETKQREDEEAVKVAEAAAARDAEHTRLATEAAAEAERLTATTKAAELADAQRVIREAEATTKAADDARADLARKAAEEFERFQRSMKRRTA